MNYEKLYDLIVDKAKNRILDKKIYQERHHIIPKCLGGLNNKENIINVTAKEHYMLHYLLIKIYPDNFKLSYAFWMMCNGSKKDRPKTSSFLYKEGRENFSKRRKGISSMKGKNHSEITKEKISKSKKGQDFWTGKKHKEATKIKMSELALGRKASNETKEKMSIRMKNFVFTEEHKNNISKAKLGKNNPMFGKKWKLENGKRIYYYPNSLK